MEDRKDVTVPMPQEMVDEIAQQLDYGDSRAEWIRDAVREKLERGGASGPDDGLETDGGEEAAVDAVAAAN